MAGGAPVADRGDQRLPVFPALAEGSAAGDTTLLRDLAQLSPKQLLLTPSEAAATDLANTLLVPSEQRYDAKDDAVGIRPFLDAEEGSLLAAGRYDGMDLKDDACHLEVLSGLPDATHLQDQFLASRLRAANVLTERIRTRVMQGAGRCTRGPQDWAVVVVHGDTLLRFLERAEVQRSLPIELQVAHPAGPRPPGQTTRSGAHRNQSANPSREGPAAPGSSPYRRTTW